MNEIWSRWRHRVVTHAALVALIAGLFTWNWLVGLMTFGLFWMGGILLSLAGGAKVD